MSILKRNIQLDNRPKNEQNFENKEHKTIDQAWITLSPKFSLFFFYSYVLWDKTLLFQTQNCSVIVLGAIKDKRTPK